MNILKNNQAVISVRYDMIYLVKETVNRFNTHETLYYGDRYKISTKTLEIEGISFIYVMDTEFFFAPPIAFDSVNHMFDYVSLMVFK